MRNTDSFFFPRSVPAYNDVRQLFRTKYGNTIVSKIRWQISGSDHSRQSWHNPIIVIILLYPYYTSIYLCYWYVKIIIFFFFSSWATYISFRNSSIINIVVYIVYTHTTNSHIIIVYNRNKREINAAHRLTLCHASASGSIITFSETTIFLNDHSAWVPP